MAAELERDPALARRVASTLAADHEAPAAASGAPAPPSGDRMVPETDAEAHGGLAGNAEPLTTPRRRTARTFKPSIITGVSPDFGPGIPDPFALARRLGPDGLRAALTELRRGTLRAMIREYGIAPATQVARVTDDAKLRTMILAAVSK